MSKRKNSGLSTKAAEALVAKAAAAKKLAETAHTHLRHIKAEHKLARKAYREARRAAKLTRKAAKAASKILRKARKKVVNKAGKPRPVKKAGPPASQATSSSSLSPEALSAAGAAA